MSQNLQPVFKHLSIKDGLSQSSVSSILQDRYGFMWFATEDGLNLYDGYSFRVFRNEPDNPKSLSSNNVKVILEDNSGSLWIGTWGGGLNLFDRENNSFIRFQNDPNNPNTISGDNIWSICEDRKGMIWIGTYGNGLNQFDPKNNKFKLYKNESQNPNSLSGDFALFIYQDKNGELWIGTNNGLNLFQRKNDSFKRFQHDPSNSKSLSGRSVSSIYEDQANKFWIGTGGGGLNLFDREKNSFTSFKNDEKNPRSLSNNIIYSINEDSDGKLWVGTWGGGLNLFDRKLNSFKSYKHDILNLGSISNDFVVSIYEDLSGLLWIGTNGGGISILDKNRNNFRHFQHQQQNPLSLSHNYVNAIAEDEFGLLWVSTFSHGINIIDTHGNVIKRFQNNPQSSSSLSHNNVHIIYKDDSGSMWIGSDAGLSLFDQQSNSFINYRYSSKNSKSLSDNTVYSLCNDTSGNLWIGTFRGGLNFLDKKQNTFKRYEHNPKIQSSLSNNTVYCIFKDHFGKVWVGTDNGLNLYDQQSDSFIHYKNNPQDPSSLSNNMIYCIYEDHSGLLWIGTAGGGLNLLNRSTGKFKRFREKGGLSNDIVYGILEDNNNRLWISTIKGISRLDLKSLVFRNFDVSDGLSSNELTFNGCFKTRDGLMYFGSIDGITVFHPDSIRKNSFKPQIVVTELLLFNQPVQVGLDYNGFVLPKSVITSDEIILSYKENVFTFEFSALSYLNPEKHKYAYRLEGFDTEWIYTDAERRFATYTNLDPGSYIFHVKGTNNDLVWNELGRSIKIVITPPWWRSTLAYIGYSFLFLGVLFSIRQYEKNRERQRHEAELKDVESDKLREVDLLKSRFFANISHEFRTPLTLILGPIKKWVEKINLSSSLNGGINSLDDLKSMMISRDKEMHRDFTMAERNTKQLLNLVNQLLDLSKIDAGKMQLQSSKRNIVSFLKGITMSFESLADNKKIKLQFISVLEELELYFDRDKMGKILINLLSNAFKFTEVGGKIEVSISFRSTLEKSERIRDLIFVSVKDTGIGISEEELPKLFDRFYQVDSSHTREHEGTGIGLALTKELIELHHGTIKVKSRVGEGSEFIVELPVGRGHLRDNEIIEEREINDELFGNENNVHINRNDEYSIKSTPPTSSSKITHNNLVIHENVEKDIILIVEDNADVRDYIKDSLGNDFLVEESANGEQGIQKAREIIPDLIISDVMMPRLGGKELTRIVKNDERTSHIPVILLTAKSEQESKIEGLKTGADDYLTKPFDTIELGIRIKNLINIRKRLQEKFSNENIIRKNDVKKLSSIDEKFLNKSLEIVEKHLSEEDFSIEEFGNEVGMSRQQLNRKIKALTGKTASLYLRTIRLLKAKRMIEEKKGNISEIAYSVGFSSPAYFSACFKEEFGYSPTNLIV